MNKKYYFLTEEQFIQLKVTYKNDEVFDVLVDIQTNQEITPENIKNIENNIQ